MKFILNRRFNLADMAVSGVAVSCFTHDMWILGLALMIIGSVISAILEIKYGENSR